MRAGALLQLAWAFWATQTDLYHFRSYKDCLFLIITYEIIKQDIQAQKIANEEYRKVLRAKNSELATLKRESEQLTKMQ